MLDVSDKELGDIYRRLDKHWSNDPEDRRTSILDDIGQVNNFLFFLLILVRELK